MTECTAVLKELGEEHYMWICHGDRLQLKDRLGRYSALVDVANAINGTSLVAKLSINDDGAPTFST
jgi:hypothetical protein